MLGQAFWQNLCFHFPGVQRHSLCMCFLSDHKLVQFTVKVCAQTTVSLKLRTLFCDFTKVKR